MALSITTFIIIGLIVTLSINNTENKEIQHNKTYITTFSITKLSIKTLYIMALDITTFSKMGLIATFSVNDTEHK